MEKTFTDQGTFEALNAACKWLRENGYSYGPMCFPFPTGILKGEYQIAKWKNLTARERRELAGTISGNFREGPITIKLKEWTP